jgi:hypothetical protein
LKYARNLALACASVALTTLGFAAPAAAASASAEAGDFVTFGPLPAILPDNQASLRSDLGKRVVEMPAPAGTEPTSGGQIRPMAIAETTIRYSWNDYRGLKSVIRQGNMNYGYLKITNKHGTDATVAKVTMVYPDKNRTQDQQSATVYYSPVNHVVCDPRCHVVDTTTVKVVHEFTQYSDGNPKGVITAYCEDPRYNPRCPDYVRDAAHRVKF